MPRFFFPAVLAMTLVCTSGTVSNAQSWAPKMFSTMSHDFGTVARGGKAEFSFDITNIFKEDVHIVSASSSCGCTTPVIAKSTLKSQETGAILCKFNSTSFLGSKSATVTVVFDKPYHAEVQLQVQGFIRSDVVFTPATLSFDRVKQGVDVEKKVRIAYAGRDDWGIVDVRSGNPHISVALVELKRGNGQVEYEMAVKLKDDAPTGYIQDQMSIVTNDTQKRAVPLTFEANVEAGLSVSPRLLTFGEVRPGESSSKKIIVRGDEPFTIQGIECADGNFEFEPRDTARKLHFIPVKFTANQTGSVQRSVTIKTDQGNAKLTLSAEVK